MNYIWRIKDWYEAKDGLPKEGDWSYVVADAPHHAALILARRNTVDGNNPEELQHEYLKTRPMERLFITKQEPQVLALKVNAYYWKDGN